MTILERNTWVGGNSASFELAGVRVDYGSHRLHPVCDPAVLRDIRGLLGDDLLDRPRHGRIRLRGRWIHFPLKPLDMVLRLPPSFALGVATDLAGKVSRRNGHAVNGAADGETFASILEAGLGRTICRDFYFPYARKIWGLAPEELSVIQARRRVSAGSIGKMLGKVAGAAPWRKRPMHGRFFYPRRGYGQICEAYAAAAQAAGARVQLGAQIQAIEVGDREHIIRYVQDGQPRSVAADHVWSTIPITALARLLRPSPPAEDLRAAEQIAYRAMLLIYLVLEQDRFSEYDAHYFPEADIPITRLSEPKNYSNGHGARDVTVLCAELPCSPDDDVWSQTDEELSLLVCRALERVEQPVTVKIKQVATRRLRNAYPIYRRGYDQDFDRLDSWIGRLDGVLTFGRQGLFTHDNLHHALYMAYCAADCLRADGTFDRARWQSYRRVFETHVVED